MHVTQTTLASALIQGWRDQSKGIVQEELVELINEEMPQIREKVSRAMVSQLSETSQL